MSISKEHSLSLECLLVVLMSSWGELKVSFSGFASLCLFSALLSKVLCQLGERLGRVKSELEEMSILAEFCAQVKSEG